MLKNLKRLTQVGKTIALPTDDRGLVGRMCPSPSCEGYFKVKPGTGLSGATACVCPYCGHRGENDGFTTPDQKEYIRSYAKHLVTGALLKDLKEAFPSRSSGGGLVQITTRVTGRASPIRRYRERELETHASCSACSLDYAVYGAFGFCPDCGEHNSLAILKMNFSVIAKMLKLAEQADSDLAQHLTDNALEDVVSSFDGFGRELARRAASRASKPPEAEALSFQNIKKADARLNGLFGVTMTSAVSADAWASILVAFQKRHVLAHSMGVVDDAYLAAAGDSTAVKGRKVRITREDVVSVMSSLRTIASFLRTSLG